LNAFIVFWNVAFNIFDFKTLKVDMLKITTILSMFWKIILSNYWYFENLFYRNVIRILLLKSWCKFVLLKKCRSHENSLEVWIMFDSFFVFQHFKTKCIFQNIFLTSQEILFIYLYFWDKKKRKVFTNKLLEFKCGHIFQFRWKHLDHLKGQGFEFFSWLQWKILEKNSNSQFVIAFEIPLCSHCLISLDRIIVWICVKTEMSRVTTKPT
jgi:hypothetical protein